MGILHLKLRKYRMALFHFSKALKFLEVSQCTQITAGLPIPGSSKDNS
ncbi:MAG: hypothetical protein ACK521_01000 [bacterium]